MGVRVRAGVGVEVRVGVRVQDSGSAERTAP